MIQAKILLDSINPSGSRLTTWILTYPRFIHAEFMTHRVFSRNASSSRAIPVKKMLDDVRNNPAMPVFWGKNQSGMQAAEELDNVNATILGEMLENHPEGDERGRLYIYDTPMQNAKRLWLQGRDNAIKTVESMQEIGLHKQIANRLLEPWMHITVIATASEHGNFFALRAHKDAQPEFQALAYAMLKEYQASTPKILKEGQWHIPFGDSFDVDRLADIVYKDCPADMGYTSAHPDEFTKVKLKIATARCARVSYLNFEGKDDYVSDVALAERLAGSGHWSPFEHCAKAIGVGVGYPSSNFRGWEQYRKTFLNENQSDPRVNETVEKA